MFPLPTSSRARVRRPFVAPLLTLVALGVSSVHAQEPDWGVLPAGRLRVGLSGVFTSADRRFGTLDGSEAGTVDLATDLRLQNAVGIFPGSGQLSAALQTILGDAGYAPTLGASDAYIQASRIEVPLSLELGVTSWFTLGVELPLAKSRVEGNLGLVPTIDDDVGVNPAFAGFAQVQAFTDELAGAAAALPAPQAAVWSPWVVEWIRAYAGSALFPSEGTPVAAALQSALDGFNAVLVAAGMGPVSTPIPLATETITTESLRVLLSDPAAHFQLLPLPTQLLWTLGDIEITGRLRLLEGPANAPNGRARYGATALGTVRLPTGAGDESRAIFDLPMGDGLLGFEGGLAAWVQTSRLGLSAAARVGMASAGTMRVRIAPVDVPLAPVANLAEVRRKPGSTLEIRLRPTLAIAAALRVEGEYAFLRRGADEFERVGPLPGAPAVLIPFPSGALYGDAGLLAEETERRVHLAGGGLRFHPPTGDFPVEVWAQVRVAVAGAGRRTMKETTLVFGGRVTRRLWGN